MEAELKKIIREHRRVSGLSQAELAKLAGVGKTVVFDIEHGKESVQFDTIKKILAALNISLSFHSPLLQRQENDRLNQGDIAHEKG